MIRELLPNLAMHERQMAFALTAVATAALDVPAVVQAVAGLADDPAADDPAALAGARDAAADAVREAVQWETDETRTEAVAAGAEAASVGAHRGPSSRRRRQRQ